MVSKVGIGLILVTCTNVLCYSTTASIDDCDRTIRAAGIPIEGISGNGPNDSRLRVDCSTCTSGQRTTALAMARTAANWTTLNAAQPLLFVSDVLNDSTVTAQVHPYLPTLIQWVDNDTMRKAIWTRIKAVLGTTVLPPAQATTIETYAANRHMPII